MATMTETENPVVSLQDKRFINIGSDPSNDLVITDDGVQPFHALLDCREEPYTLVPLSLDGEITLNGMQVPTHQALQIGDNDTLSLGNHRLRILPASGDSPLRLAVASGQNTAEEANALPGLVQTDMTGPAQDDIILASVDKDAAEISVDQTAIFVLTLGNGSPIVSTFHVQVDGIPDDWVLVSPANVNLNEGARGMVTVEITPPRRPTSTAGEHQVRFTITSHNHPDRRVTLLASLTIQPYYDFGISDLTPQRRRIGWRQKTGLVTMEVANRGNNTSPFLFSAQDEENGCRFQFVDNNNLRQPGQMQCVIPPGETRTTEMHIAPVKRSLVRMRSQNFPYRVISSQPENAALTLFTTGTAVSSPLINALGLFIIAALLICITGYLFTPRINSFKADNNLIGVGESTTLRWKTSPFTHNVAITGVEKAISGSQGAMQVFPALTVNTYTLTASTWLWSLLGLTPREMPVTVMAVPGEPVISTFTVSSEEALVGDEVTLRWSVDNTDKLLLTINGVTETFEDSNDFNGERKLAIEKATLISLEAINSSGTIVDSRFIEVSQPSIVIERFELSQSTITTGDQVTISWKVSGVGMADGGEVTISAFDSVLPLEGQMTFFPKESMEFVLTARNRKLQESRILPVGVLEPGTPPSAPTIDFFTAAPSSLVGPGNVELAWSVSGAYDSISISNGSAVVAKDLSAQGFRTISVSDSGTYVLTATYEGKSAGANLQITVDPALIKPILVITSVYPETNLEMGDSSVVSISITNPDVDDAPPTGQIVITDSTSSCVIELPKTNCTLTFETPGNKTITASYQGDSLHVQTVSDPYPTPITVLGNTITLGVTVFPNNNLYYFNQKVTVRVIVNGTNPSRVPDGELRVQRICDESGDASYPENDCVNEVIGYHKLTAADSGSYKFTDLQIDQLGGTWKLAIGFSVDSFYNPADAEVSLTVDDTPRPIKMELTTTDVLPGLNNHAITYTIRALDENIAGVFYVPEGTVSLTATHSDGVTLLSCNDLTLTDSGDGVSSTATCTITPTKSGVWSMSASYKVASTDVIHVDTDEDFDDLIVNSNVYSYDFSGTSTVMYGNEGTASVKLARAEDTSVMITDGTLSCAFPNGVSDGACTCAHVSGGTWGCSYTPMPADTLPASKIITFTYTPVDTAFLNEKTWSYTVTVQKATTVASINPGPASTYQVDGTYSFQISAAHATAGGAAPTGGKVTAILGTGPCSSTNGMTSGQVSTSTVDLGTSQSFTFASAQQNKTLTVCYRYDGDSSHYAASNYTATSSFTITSQSTTASIATQPDSTTPYEVGDTFAITVNAVRTSNSSSINTGNVSIQLGTGNCTSTSGMIAGVISTWSNTVGSPRTVTFALSHVVGQNLRFCVRYDGDSGTLSASPWVASNDLRVMAVPNWSSTAAVEFAASQTQNVKGSISVTLNNAYHPISSHVQIVLNDTDHTVLCPTASGDTQKTCTLKSASSTDGGTTTTYVFDISTNTAQTWTAMPRYLNTLGTSDVDSNNATALGTTFTIKSVYQLTVGQVNSSEGCSTCSGLLLGYTPYEVNSSDIMMTNLTSTLTVANFTSFDFTSAGLSAAVTGLGSGGSAISVDPSSGGCTITNSTNAAGTQVGLISCPSIRVTNSMVSNFQVTVTPTNPSAYPTALNSTVTGGINVYQNIIEESTGGTYDIRVNNGGCDGKQQIFEIVGYAAGTGDTSQVLKPEDFVFYLACEKDNDGDSDWDYFYTYDKDSATFSENLSWDTSTLPYKFSFTVKGYSSNPGYSGCEKNSDGVRFSLSLNDIPNASFFRDFEDFYWSTGDTYLNDDRGGTETKFDVCKDN
jgi:hypothetical protein